MASTRLLTDGDRGRVRDGLEIELEVENEIVRWGYFNLPAI